MGGRGTSGATYNRRIKLARQISSLDEQITQLQDKVNKAARTNDAEGTLSTAKFDGVKKALKISGAIEAPKENAKLHNLENKKKRLTEELRAINQGQRVLF